MKFHCSFYEISKTHVAAMWVPFISVGAKRKEDGVEEKALDGGLWHTLTPTSYYASMLLCHCRAALKCPGHEVLQ